MSHDDRYDGPDSPNSVGWVRAEDVRLADEDDPLRLKCGQELFPVDVEYETYGELNQAKDNVVLICHALSGDAHAAGWDSEADKRPWRKDRPGWWDGMIGPGKAYDTDEYFVICSNVLGSCYGTTGPSSVDPDTGEPYGLDFPVVTVEDWVRLERRLLDHLEIDDIHTVSGGSLGGAQAMEWALTYPEMVKNVHIVGASDKLSAQGLAFNAVSRYAIMSDPRFNEGDYYRGEHPADGLSVARRLAHITYLSDKAMEKKFGRMLKGEGPSYKIVPEFEVESYLDYQGSKFVSRFDANSYIYITKAMDYYDASSKGGGDIKEAFQDCPCRFLLVSFSTDWLYDSSQIRAMGKELMLAYKDVSYIDIPSDAGHDAFLIEIDKLGEVVKAHLQAGDIHG